MASFYNAISWGTSAMALVPVFLEVSASVFRIEPPDLATAAHEGHLRRSPATVSSGEGLPSSSLDSHGDKAPVARSRSGVVVAGGAGAVHRTTMHDSHGGVLWLGGQGEDEEEGANSVRDEDHLAHGTTVGEPRDGGSDALDLVTMDTRRLTTSSSAELYPNCTGTLEIADGAKIGDNYCDSMFNKPECGYDGGDCCECDCGLQSSEPLALHSLSNNTCGVNKYICVDPASDCFEDLYPDCVSRGGTLEWIGNGACWWANNNEACGYDGGDCCECDCVGNLDNRCGVNDYDCRDPSSPSECPEEAPTPSPQTQSPTISPVDVSASPVVLTASPVDATPSVTAEGDGGSDGIAVEITIGVVSTVVGGVVLALVTKHCVGERGSSSESAGS